MDSLVPATLAHADALAQTIRPEDLAELRASDPRPPAVALRAMVTESIAARALLLDGAVAALWGVVPLGSVLGPWGVVWAMSGTAVNGRKKTYAKVTSAAIHELLTVRPQLVAAIDARYSAAIRWAQWLGMRLLPPTRQGPENRLFYPAVIERT